LHPKDRDIAMVFQSYALYPHMNVAGNMSYSLKLRKTAKEKIASAVGAAASKLGLDPLLERRPKALSGGQRQRVAMGRAIVRQPKAFLFDEPLSNLDARLREQMRAEIKKLHGDLKATSIYVTHDQIEAMTLADRIVAMHGGVVQQVGSPLELYDRPANLFVAGFIGSPGMNFSRRPTTGGTCKLKDGTVVALPQPLSFRRRHRHAGHSPRARHHDARRPRHERQCRTDRAHRLRHHPASVATRTAVQDIYAEPRGADGGTGGEGVAFPAQHLHVFDGGRPGQLISISR
jgi:multiple sugar transport system ATP-binding protein